MITGLGVGGGVGFWDEGKENPLSGLKLASELNTPPPPKRSTKETLGREKRYASDMGEQHETLKSGRPWITMENVREMAASSARGGEALK